MISEELKTIFVHIPKTAGTSIEAFLKAADAPSGSDHQTLAAYAKAVDIAQYFTFSFVRNPYDRAISLFNYYKNGGNQQQHKYGIINSIYDYAKSGGQHFVRHSDMAIAQNMPQQFPAFCKKYFRDQEDFFGRNNLQPQHNYITIQNEIKVEFIGKFENLENDFKVVTNKIGKKGTLPHFRKNNTASLDFKLDEITRKIIFEFYRKDFEMFGYDS